MRQTQLHAHLQRRKQRLREVKRTAEKGQFSIGSSDSGARGPSATRDAWSRAEVCGVCGQRALSQARRGAERAGRFGLGAASPLLPQPLPPSSPPCRGRGHSPPPGLRSPFPTPGSWLPHSPTTAPGHPPGSARSGRCRLSHRGRSPPRYPPGSLPLLYGTHYNFQLFLLLFTLSP